MLASVRNLLQDGTQQVWPRAPSPKIMTLILSIARQKPGDIIPPPVVKCNLKPITDTHIYSVLFFRSAEGNASLSGVPKRNDNNRHLQIKPRQMSGCVTRAIPVRGWRMFGRPRSELRLSAGARNGGRGLTRTH